MDPGLRVSGFMELVRGFKAQYGGAQRWRRRVVIRKAMKRIRLTEWQNDYDIDWPTSCILIIRYISYFGSYCCN